MLEEKAGSYTTQRYVWSPVYVDALVLRDRDTNGDGTLDERLWVQQDANWNVTAVTDGTGAVVERYVYDPYGVQTVYSPTYGTVRSSSLYSMTIGFQGMQYDSISGLNEANERWYSSSLGVWTSLDPIFFQGGDDRLYGFVGNNPVNSLDPTGEAELKLGYKDVNNVEADIARSSFGEFRWDILWQPEQDEKLKKAGQLKKGVIVQWITIVGEVKNASGTVIRLPLSDGPIWCDFR